MDSMKLFYFQSEARHYSYFGEAREFLEHYIYMISDHSEKCSAKTLPLKGHGEIFEKKARKAESESEL